MEKDIRKVSGDKNNQLIPSQSPRPSAQTSTNPYRSTSFPEIPALPELPPMPTFNFSDYNNWIKELEASMKKWEADMENYRLETQKWYDENYDTANYIDDEGFSVYEAVSKDGRYRIVMKVKSYSNEYYSSTRIWLDGEEVYSSGKKESQTTSKSSAGSRARSTVVTTRQTTPEYRTTRYQKRYSKKSSENSGCCGCLIIMLIIAAVIILAVIGLKSLF